MKFDLFYIIGQILGAVAVILGFAAFQRKTQREIIIFQCATAVIFSIHYCLIDAPTAVVLNLLSALICVCFAFRNNRQSKSKGEVIISSLIFTIAGVFVWESIYSVFLIAGLVVNSVSLSFSNPQNTRRAMLIKSPLCIAYNLSVTSMGGVVFECAVLVSAIIGLIKTKVQGRGV